MSCSRTQLCTSGGLNPGPLNTLEYNTLPLRQGTTHSCDRFLINMLTALKGSVLFLFAITADGIVPCGGPKKSPSASSIVQITFSF